MTVDLGPTVQLELDRLVADAQRDLADAQAAGDDEAVVDAQDRLADLADLRAHISEAPLVGDPD